VITGTYDVCPICGWEHDPVQADDPDFEVGANRPSLRQAQANYIRNGSADVPPTVRVRLPAPDDERWAHWELA
jgi:hypothetical protein